VTFDDHEWGDQLNDYLDDLSAGEALRDIDPAEAEAVRRFFARDDTPPPPRDLTSQIWEDLMNQSASAGTVPLHPPFPARPPLNGRTRYRPWRQGPRRLTSSHSQRRLGLAQLAAVVLLVVTLGSGYFAIKPLRGGPDQPRSMPAAVGPSASPTATPYFMTGHLIIGMWQFDLETILPGTDLAYFNFAEYGAFEALDEQGNWVAFGNWRATGERTAELVYVQQGIPIQRMFNPDYVAAGNVLSPDKLTLRLSLQIDVTGNTVTADGEGIRYRSDGTVAATFNGPDAHMIGTRMAVIPTAPTLTPTP
jgi:hypothetical protein